MSDSSGGSPIVYLNGEFLPLQHAKISVMDRGFLFGDGVYEVIPVYTGRFFRLDEHLRRLENSLRGIRISPPLDRAEWRQILDRLVDGDTDQSVYLQISRGAYGTRDHAIPKQPAPTVFAMVSANPHSGSDLQGVSAITLNDSRWQQCQIKAITLLANVLARQAAVDKSCEEAILVRDGLVTEGAASNVFIYLNGTLMTPPKGKHLLPGITRDLVLELAAISEIKAGEAQLTVQQLRQSEEIWLTSSTREIVPVIELDGQSVGAGDVGQVWRTMHAAYQDYKVSLPAH